MIINVRHAQDFDYERAEGPATATFHIRSLRQFEVSAHAVLCDVVLPTPDGQISLGDADEELVLSASGCWTRVILYADEVDPTGLEQAWLDLIPVKE